jgi:6-phosphogluconolactonase
LDHQRDNKQAEKPRAALYAAVGRVITSYDIQIESATLVRRASLKLPFKVQYVWPHPSAPFLYAACSNGSPVELGDAHCVVALRMDPASGALSVHGVPAPLSARPIHITVDGSGKHALIAYNNPSSLTVHHIETDAMIGGVVAQQVEPDAGMYAHQVRVAPLNKMAIIVTRGNDAKGRAPEDPGALKVFAYDDGQLNQPLSVAPEGGYGFGPRHLDFHPKQPWVYVSLERQNLLHMFCIQGSETMALTPSYVKETLAEDSGARPRQRAGTVHVHPNGQFVYVANRASGVSRVDGKDVYVGGENNIAVFKINPRNGEPVAIQHADTRGIVPRTFALDSSGRLLIAANSVPILARQGGDIVTVPPSLAVFRVGDNGMLDYVGKTDVEVGEDSLFWMGIVF